jgi:pyruvate dehydrogenase E2 component (dihydrolipoamide acetyltransferase)
MALEIVMPKLGWTMEEGVLAEWMKKDGDPVKPGDILFTVESDKALQEVEAFDAGILRIPPDSPPLGSTIKVGGLLAYLVQPGEASPLEAGQSSRAATPQVNAVSALESQPDKPTIALSRTNGATVAISPRARRVAAELGVEWTSLHGSGRTGRIIERDIRSAAQHTAPTPEPMPAAPVAQGIDLTPVARRAAVDLNVDLAALAARFAGKRISREDVERFAAESASVNIVEASADDTRTPISRIRRLTADAMSRSAHTTAPVTLTTEADATALVRLRKALKGTGREPIPTYNDLLIKLSAAALEQHPAMNARLEGEEIVQSSAVHIGLAVDTPRGLLVPVIKDVQRKTVRQVAQESLGLIEATRSGTIRSDALQGSTFSITNLGMYEIDAFTPIINLPDCAILGVGRIVPKQVVIDAENEQVAIRHMMFLSLTFDHRVVDGAPAARFLQQIKHFIEQPLLWLVG